MKYLRKIGYGMAFTLGSFLILTLVLTLFSYINWFQGKMVHFVMIIIPIISLLLGGFVVGKMSEKDGWLEGLKFSGIFLVFLILFNYLGLRVTPEVQSIIFYLIMIVSTVLGSMVGINRKKNNE